MFDENSKERSQSGAEEQCYCFKLSEKYENTNNIYR